MKSSLLLITSSFPFGTGESFLETEIEFLSEQFSHVTIIPTSKIDIGDQRKLPKNFTVDISIVQKKNSENKFKRILSKFFGMVLFPPFFWEIKNLFPNRLNLSTLSNLLLFTRDAILTKTAINNLLSEFEIYSQKIVIYSYWLNGSSLGAKYNYRDVPVISRVHSGDLYENLYPENYIPYRNITLDKLNHIFPISKSGFNYLKNKYPEFENKISLSRLGINIPEINLLESNTTNKQNIVSCSAIDQNKRVDQIALSLKLFAKNNPEKSLIWHHFGDGPLRSKIESIITEFPSNLKAQLHGFVPNKDLLDWYGKNEVTIFINLSLSEGIPVSIMEAYGFGIPCIATDVGGTSEIVTNQNGWMIDSDFTLDSIHDMLSIALTNESIRFKKAQYSKKTCKQFFNSKENYPEFINLIKKHLKN